MKNFFTTIPSAALAWILALFTSVALGLPGHAFGDSTQPATFSLNGSVVDSDGNPIKDANVRCYQAKRESLASNEEPVVERTARTDAKGQFEFPVSATPKIVIVESRELAPSWVWLDEPTEKRLSFILSPPREFSGFVTDTNKHPIANAEVWCVFVTDEAARARGRTMLFQQSMLFGSFARKMFSARTEADGSFHIGHFPQHGSALLAARAPGFASRPTSSSSEQWYGGGVGARAGQANIQIQMVPTAVYQSRLTVGGTDPIYDPRSRTIVDPGKSGQPVANAEVVLEPEGETWAAQRMVTTTTTNGTFRFLDVPPGRYGISGEQRDLKLMVKHVSIYVQPGQSLTNPILRAFPVGSAFVRVLSSNGTPIAAATITMGERQFETHADGSHLFDLPEGNYNVHVQKQRFNDSGADVIVRGGQTNVVTIHLKDRPKIIGIVVGPDGKPVAKAQIIGFILEPTPDFNMESSADGKFELPWHENWDSLVQREKGSGVIARVPSVGLVGYVPFESGKRDMTIKVEPGLTIHGKVTDEKGKPMPHVKVVAMVRGDRGPMHLQFDSVTGADGQFAIEALPLDHQYYVRPVIDGFRQAPARVEAGQSKKVELDPFVVGKKQLPPNRSLPNL